MRSTPRRSTARFSRPAPRAYRRWAVALLLAAVAWPAAAGDGRFRGHSQPAQPRHQPQTPRAVPPASAPSQHAYRPSLMGSATGVPPGYYNRMLGYPDDAIFAVPTIPVISPFPVYFDDYRPAPATPQPIVIVQQVQAPPPVIIREQAPAPEPRERTRPARPAAPEPPPPPRPTEPQKVHFEVAPADAVLMLDGRRLGTAAELSARSEPLSLDPGVYILKVDHPSYKAQRLVFGVSASTVRVNVDLAAEPMYRARVQ